MKSPAPLQPFLKGLYKGLDQDDQDQATEITDSYFDTYRRNTRTFLFDENDFPGWRGGALTWDPTRFYTPEENRERTHSTRVKFVGVLDDGRIAGGALTVEANLAGTDLAQAWMDKNAWEATQENYQKIATSQAQALACALHPDSTQQEAQNKLAQSLDTMGVGSFQKRLNHESGDDPHSDPIEHIVTKDTDLPLAQKGRAVYTYCTMAGMRVGDNLTRRLQRSGLLKFTEPEATDDFDNVTFEEPEHSPKARALYAGIKKFQYMVTKQEQRSLAKMRTCITSRLNPETLKTARSLNDVTPDAINWLEGQDINPYMEQVHDRKTKNTQTITPQTKPEVLHPVDGEARETSKQWRRQAVATYPALAGFMMRVPKIARAIDSGDSVSRSLQAALGTTAATLDKLRGQTWQRTGRDLYRNPKPTVETLKHIPLEFVPQNKKQWTQFAATKGVAEEFWRHTETPVEETLKGVKGRFDTIAKMSEHHVQGGFADAGNHISRHLTRAAVMHTLHAQGMDKETTLKATNWAPVMHKDGPTGRNVSLRQAMETADKWHRVQARYDADILTDLDDDKPWPAIKAPKLNGVDVVELNSSPLLREEGKNQDHCVGGYSQECLSADSLIFSIRKGDKTLSTLEVTPDQKRDGTWGFVSSQNMGKSNTKPSKEALTAEKEILADLNGRDPAEISDWRERLRDERDQRSRQKQTPEKIIGFDAFDSQKLKAAYETMRPCLPKSWAKKNFETWMDTTIAPIARHVSDEHTKTQERGARPKPKPKEYEHVPF